MLASGNSGAVVLSSIEPIEQSSIHNYFNRQGIERASNDKMIPLNSYKRHGRRLNTDKNTFDRHRCAFPRLNSAPDLHKPELPPILNQNHGRLSILERKNRPLTPLVNSNHQTNRTLPKNYRINLDLVPLVEAGPVGSCVGSLPISRIRQSSLSSSDSCYSSSTPSPPLQKKPSDIQRESMDLASFRCFQKRANSAGSEADSLEEGESDNEDADSKDTMILRWLETVEKSHETTSELLPCIKEGKLA